MRHPALEALVYQYLAERRAAGTLAPSTTSGVRSTLLRLAAAVGPVPASRITAAVVEDWLAGTRVGPGTARNQFSTAHSFFRWLVRRGHIRVDPMTHLRPPRAPRPVPRTVDAASVRILIGILPDSRARFLVVWAVQLGLRAVELSRLEAGDIDHERRSVVVRGKGGWQRLLPIPDEAWSAYVTYMVERPARAGPVVRSFTHPWQPLTPHYVSRLLSGWMRAAGIPQTGHALRHSAAAHILRGGKGDIRDVQDVLGHQSLMSTSVYLPHADLERLRAIMSGRWYGPREKEAV